MCAVSDELVILIMVPYTILRIVSLPSKSVRERFRMGFNMEEDSRFRIQVQSFN